MKGELELPFTAGEVPRRSDAHDLPLIYIASPLTRADQSPEQRRSVTFQVDKIVATIQDPRSDGEPPQFRTHAPAVLSAPWSSDASQSEIYRENTRLVLAEADAIIILSLHGGSSGTGQELELACRAATPDRRCHAASAVADLPANRGQGGGSSNRPSPPRSLRLRPTLAGRAATAPPMHPGSVPPRRRALPMRSRRGVRCRLGASRRTPGR